MKGEYNMFSINVNTEKKAKAIIAKLKSQGRLAFYEQFADHKGFFYSVFYKGV